MSELSYAERRALPLKQVSDALKAAAPNGMRVGEIADALGRNYVGTLSLVRRMAKRGKIFGVVVLHSAMYFANEADRDALSTGDLLKDRAPLQTKIIAFVSTCRLGASQRHIRTALGISQELCTPMCASMVRKTKRMFACGPLMFRRYFADKEHMESVEAETLADIERERDESTKAAIEARRTRQREAYRAEVALKPKRAPAKKKEPKPKASKAGHSDFAANTFQKRTAPKAPPKPVGPAIVPDHVKVQVIPGFSRGRFEVTEAPPLFSLVGIGRDVNTGRAWGQP